jgi:hypothetical protein
VKGFDKGGPTGEPRIRQHRPFLKDCSLDLVRMIFAGHGRKALFPVEKRYKLQLTVENRHTPATVENQHSLVEMP